MKKQLIIKDSHTAREVNEIDKPRLKTVQQEGGNLSDYENWVKKYEQAESSLKEYRIEGIDIISEGKKRTIPFIYNNGNMSEVFPIGSIHTFEVNEETGTCIIL